MSGAQSSDAWDALTYNRYLDERSRPFADLIARVGATAPAEVVDLGCGTGSGLADLAQRWPAAHLVGVDSSADMLAAAQTELRPLADVTLVRAQAQAWAPETAVDVLVSNALLQWIPDHARLLARMARWLTPGGWLALQVPGNFEAPSHELLRQLVNSAQWVDRLGGVLRGADSVFDAAGYFRILTVAGLEVDAWETTYLHVLTGPDPVLRWTTGTALRPVLAVLTETEAQEFSNQYAELLRSAYPADEHGRVLFPFRRVFAVGHC
ncbi:MAG: methyltransferase domain-containing protein [Actinomycetota bacterium]|nr:methyltransferase domain-containing protein [Actinomycetota bacterium]